MSGWQGEVRIGSEASSAPFRGGSQGDESMVTSLPSTITSDRIVFTMLSII